MKGWLGRLVSTGAVVAALALSACIVRPGPGGDTNTGGNGGGGGAGAIVIRNNSDQTICRVKFSSTASSEWGNDQLGESETIGPGESRSWNVNGGGYDIRMEDCNGGVMAERRGVTVSGSTDVTFP